VGGSVPSPEGDQLSTQGRYADAEESFAAAKAHEQPLTNVERRYEDAEGYLFDHK
jgi:hypothetical protein